MTFRKSLERPEHGQITPPAADSQPVSSSLAFNEEWAARTFVDCHDVIMKQFVFGQTAVTLLYCEGLADTKQLNETILPSLHAVLAEISAESAVLTDDILRSKWTISSLKQERALADTVSSVFNGELVLFLDGLASAFIVNIADPPKRNPEDSNTEISIRGSRDGFIENLAVNVALIRKRLRTESLSYEQYTLGRRSKTKVGLLYIKDVIRPQIVDEVKQRLAGIDTDAVYSTNQLEELLAEKKFTLFPLFDYTGRADYVVASLLRGRFVIVLDGVPTVIIGPTNLMMIIKTSEDLHSAYSSVTYGRILRLAGLLISLFLPGFYIAIISYHQDQVPLTLLATLVMSRKGVPLPAPAEALIMLLLFELFKEAGLRLPQAIGQTLGVVGGLIIGDAAIRSGLTSPSLLVVIGSTAVATYSLVNQTLSVSVSILRIAVLLMSAFLGIFGFILSIFIVLIMLSNLRSFGIPYLAPISPFTPRDAISALVRLPASFQKRRPKMLHVQDATREGSDS
ncbi:MAG: spore germination protein [Clostridia bacterium]